MKIFKKAQTATEYLIVLAVVIIIALIVVSAMGGLPGIGGAAKTRASAAFWSSADVAISSYAISYNTGNNTANMTVRNNLKDTITSLTVSLDGNSISCAKSKLKAGGSTTCNQGGLNTAFCSAAGDAFSSAVSITYTDKETGASYTYTGDGQSLEGTCAT